MGFDRKLQARHRRDTPAVACHRHADLPGADAPARGFDCHDAVALAHEPLHFAVLDDVDAKIRGAARVAPGHCVVAGRSPAALHQAADDRKARVVGAIEQWNEPRDLLARHPLGIDAVEPHAVAAPEHRVTLRLGVGEVDHAARAEHHVVIQLLRELMPELERPLIEHAVFIGHVVRPDDRGVSTRVAPADVALFKDGHVAHAMILGKVERCGEAMASAANDHDVVMAFGFGAAPRLRPAAMARQGLAREGEDGIFHPCTVRPAGARCQ